MSGIVCKIIAYMGLGSELAAFLPYLFAKEGLEGARWMTGRTSLPQSKRGIGSGRETSTRTKLCARHYMAIHCVNPPCKSPGGRVPIRHPTDDQSLLIYFWKETF
ncbi:23241_t:CDS:2, partial [Rhizophagus irregularis]